jgi:hypothetical protein
MLSSFATLFCKRSACPASCVLLEFRRSRLTTEDSDQVRAHLTHCEFCGAEVQLLAHYRDAPVDDSFAPMPLHLRRLAEDLLGISTTGLTDFPKFGEQRELSR